MRRRLGIWISRRNLTLVGIMREGNAASISYTLEKSRALGQSSDDLLRESLIELASEWRESQISIALSWSDLACADCFEVPYRREGEIEEIVGSLAESRCTGWSAEDLCVDLSVLSKTNERSTIDLLAIPEGLLRNIREAVRSALPKSTLCHVCSAPSVLAATLFDRNRIQTLGFLGAGEGIAIHFEAGQPRSWRSFPLDNAEKSEDLLKKIAASIGPSLKIAPANVSSEIKLIGGLNVAPQFAVAAAAGIAIPAKMTNVLRGAPDAPRNPITRLRSPLVFSGLAAAVVIFVAGLLFNRQSHEYRSQLNAYQEEERILWKEILPAEQYKPSSLTARMKQILIQRNKTADANRYPSALASWAEMATVFPNPDSIGMSLESLNIGPDGGRITGRVKRGNADPLSNAAILEGALNQSPLLAARGEFETKESEILVHMHLDFHAPALKTQGVLK